MAPVHRVVTQCRGNEEKAKKIDIAGCQTTSPVA